METMVKIHLEDWNLSSSEEDGEGENLVVQTPRDGGGEDPGCCMGIVLQGTMIGPCCARTGGCAVASGGESNVGDAGSGTCAH